MAFDDLSPLTGKPSGAYTPPTPLDVPVPARFRREGQNRAATPARVTTVPTLRYRDVKGSNCTLTFGHDGNRSYRCRVTRIMHGFEVVAQESQGRYARVFYPRKASISQFAIQVSLVNEGEMNDFMTYLDFFVNSMLNRNANKGATQLSMMTVNVPARNFLRYGIPVVGMGFDHHVASMVFEPVIIFEAARDPLDPDFNVDNASSFQGASDPDARYFYPSSDQLGGRSAAESSLYDIVNDAVTSGGRYTGSRTYTGNQDLRRP